LFYHGTDTFWDNGIINFSLHMKSEMFHSISSFTYAVMLRQSTKENPLKMFFLFSSIHVKMHQFYSFKPYTNKIMYDLLKMKKNIIRNQSQRSRDHIKEKVASWPLKPNRTTAYACSIEVMKEPADSGYPILQEKCVAKCWISFN
jgi:hypothetical protein